MSGKGWTVTDSPNIGTDYVRLKALSDSNGTNTTFPYTALLDVSPADGYPFWSEEVADELSSFTSTLGWTPTTLAYPYGGNNSALQAYLQGVLGLIGARTTDGSYGANYNLSSLNVYTIDCGVPVDGGYFTTGTRWTSAASRSVYNFAAMQGGIYCILTHHADEMTTSQVGWMIDEIKNNCGGNWYRFADAVTAIRADHTTSDNLIYSKSYPDNSNYHLYTDSPGIAAGTNLGLTMDFEDAAVGNQPNIGIYETTVIPTPTPTPTPSPTPTPTPTPSPSPTPSPDGHADADDGSHPNTSNLFPAQ